MTGQMIEFDANGATAPGYLATPDTATGPGVVVLHTWWGLTEPFRQVCDRLAESGYIALQNHDPTAVVSFKEISVEPLKAKKPKK